MPWDHLLDLLDGLDGVTDAADLADAGIDVADLAAAVDLGDGADGLWDVVGDLDLGGARIAAEWPSGEELEIFVPSEADFPELFDAACDGIDPALLEGLTVDSSGAGLDDGTLGTYDRSHGHVVVDAADPQAWVTLNHEIGHHLLLRDDALLERLTPLLEADGFAADQAEFLDLYDPADRAEELGAEALARYRFNPFAFELKYPRAAALLAELWG
jgi:hypothetical protein